MPYINKENKTVEAADEEFLNDHELWVQIDAYSLDMSNFTSPIRTERQMFVFENMEAKIYMEPN